MSKHQFTARTKARKRAIDVVFEADQRGMGSNGRVLEDLLRERRIVTAAQTPLPDYSVRAIEGVARNLRRIDGLISTHSTKPGLDRIPAVDLAAMRVAVWEMLENQQDVPPVVAIDQAVAIVKSISTDESPAFVNAVLDAVRREIGTVTAPAPERRAQPDDVEHEQSGDPQEDVAAEAPVTPEAPVSDTPDVSDSEEDSELDELLGEY